MMMIEHAALLKSAAGQIDAHDERIRTENEGKKDIFAIIRETVAPEQFRAWRDAVKLRQKRRVDKDALEAHDSRVQAMLLMLEGELPKATKKTPVVPLETPANGIADEMAPTRAHVQAHEAENHDPKTGEIIEPQAIPGTGTTAQAAGAASSLAAPAADLPDVLTRRAA